MYQRFLELLSKSGETVAQVAKSTGIRESVFSNWKARQGNLSVENLVKVANHFNVPLEFFIPTE